MGARGRKTAEQEIGLASDNTEKLAQRPKAPYHLTELEAIVWNEIVNALQADWFRGSGLLVIIDHGDGYMSLYAHNQSLLKEPGDWVDSSEVIATVGNSGGQKTSGLYFEIRHNGEPTDPIGWCKRV